MVNLIKETQQIIKQKLQEHFEHVENIGPVYFAYGKYQGRAYSDLFNHLHYLYGLIPNVLISTPRGEYYFYGEEAYCDKLKASWGGYKNNELFGLYSVALPFNNKTRKLGLHDVVEVLL